MTKKSQSFGRLKYGYQLGSYKNGFWELCSQEQIFGMFQ